MFNSRKKNQAATKAYIGVFNTVSGKIVLQDLMENFGIIGSCFDPDPYEMARKEGERNVVLRILSTINIDESRLLDKIKENAGRDQQYFEEEYDA